MSSKHPGRLSKKKSKRRKHRESGFEEWGGYMAAKKQKLELQFEENKALELMVQKETKIFEGIGIFVNGYTDPSAYELKRLMLIHGGTYYHYHSSKVTHIIASNLPKSKMKLLKTQIFVTADWITDSIKAGKCLPYQNYLLYAPEVADKQQRLQVENYFQKKPHSSSSTENHAVDSDATEKKNEDSFFLEENSESDSSIQSESNALLNLLEKDYLPKKSPFKTSYQNSIANNHNKVSLPLKSSSDIKISTSGQNQSISYKSASHSKASLNYISSPTFKEGALPKMNDNNESMLEELFGEDFDSDSSMDFKQIAQSRPVKDNTLHKNSGHRHDSSSSMNQSTGQNSSVSPQKHRAVKAGDPNFLPEFFNHSRKHHISTSAQELKRYVQYLVESNKEKYFPKRERLRELARQFPNDSSFIASDPTAKNKAGHVIMHLDMDCFFVSVGLRKHPELKGLPVAVTHSKGKKGGPQEGSDIQYEASHYTNESKKKLNGVISGAEASKSSNMTPKVSMYSKEYGSLSEVASCSYEARKAGVRNGLFLGEALRRCPNLQTIPYDFEGYSEVSKQLYDIVASYTLDIEAVSCDELYIDCTELLQDVQLSQFQFASILRAEIEKETGCTASAGMGSNMLLARLPTKVAKPNGLHYVHSSDVENFMKQQKIGDLPGIGYRTAEKFHSLNVRTCEDLQSWSVSKLQQEFGPKTGQVFYNNCRGKDNRAVQYYKDRKSVSAEVNYGIRFESEEDIYNFINELSVEVQSRIQKLNSKGKLVTLKLMVRKSDAPVETAKYMGHGVCDHLSHSASLKSSTDSSQVISKICCKIAQSLKIKPQDYRGVGIQLSKLEPVEKYSKTKTSIFNVCSNKSTSEIDSNNGIFAPKRLEKVNKVIPEKSTITHFLSSKSPVKHLVSAHENNTAKIVSPAKPSESSSRNGKRTNTIQHFLSKRPSTSKTATYNIADYLPQEIDQSVLEALPEDLKREVLGSCKVKTVGNTSNQNASPTGLLGESIKSLCQKQRTINSKDTIGSDSLQSEKICPDQSFLNALPEDLRKEVQGSCKVKSLEIGFEASNQNVSTSSTGGVGESTKSLCHKPKTKNSEDTVNSNFVQSATIGPDQSFLNALPEDLRKEVLDSYGSISNDKHKKSPLKSSDPQPSTSFAPKLNNAPKLDESVLNALPEDLRKEVLESYTGYSTSKTHISPQPSISNLVSSSKECGLIEQSPPKEATEDNKSDEFCGKKYPTIAGVYKLDDVRNLIKEWIDSTDEPLEEDIDDLKTFLVKLCDVEFGNVEILSKYLYRMAKKANQKWKDVYLNVIQSVQKKIYSIFHATLELSSEFPT